MLVVAAATLPSPLLPLPSVQVRADDSPAATAKSATNEGVVATTSKAADDSPEFTPAIKNKLQNQVRQKAPEARAATLRELGRYVHVDAARLILQYGLKDRSPQVAATAAEALAPARQSREIVDLLADELRQESTKRKKLSSDYPIRLAAVLADFRTVESLQKLLDVVGEVDPAVRLPLVEPILAMVDRAGERRDVESLEALAFLTTTGLYQRSHGVRKCVVDAARKLPDARAIGLLVAQMQLVAGQLRYDIVEHVTKVTGQRFGEQPGEWLRWWERNGPAFKYPEDGVAPTPDGKPLTAEGGTPLFYYDLPIRAERIVFVLDTSKSMASGVAVSRMDAAKLELAKTISNLPPETQFNLVMFNSTTARWRDGLQFATPQAKKQAIDFVRVQKPAGRTATYDALQSAMSAGQDVEAIYLLSDGAPTDGTIVAPAAILEAIRRQNFSRRLALYTLGACAGQTNVQFEEFLRRLADQNFGQYRRID
ncbi:MAG TPA: VWA domain-containing protein [Pirellulaceae bacterium]|nr:VWA domain-containing protein [Pirellulaceae bacterium]